MTAYTTIRNGYWDDSNGTTGPWSPAGRPIANDTVTISHTVTIRGNECIGNGTSAPAVGITTGGRLKWAEGTDLTGDWTFEVRGGQPAIRVYNTGIFEIGNEVTPIPVGRVATLYFNGSATSTFRNDDTAQIKLCGSSLTTVPRTKLAVNANSGASSFVVDDAPDWVNGQVVWLGTGGDIASAPTGYEQVTVSSVVGTTVNISGVLASNHFDGDFAVMATKNVVVQGKNGTTGTAIYANVAAPIGTILIYMSHVRFLYMGTGAGPTSAVAGFSASGGDPVYTYADCYSVNDCAFDSPGSASGAVGIAFAGIYNECAGTMVFNRNCFYGTYRAAYYFSGTGLSGTITSNDDTIIGGRVVERSYNYALHTLEFNGLWACGNGRSSALTEYAFKYVSPHKLTSFFITNYGLAVYDAPATTLERDFNNAKHDLEWTDGTFCHLSSASYAQGIHHNSNLYNRYLRISNVVFRDFYNGALTLTGFAGFIRMINCSFNGCNTASTTTGLAAPLSLPGSTGSYTDVFLLNCTFGTIVRNNLFNIATGSAHALGNNPGGRFVFQGCTFKEPNSFAWAQPVPGQSFYQNALGWMLQDHSRNINLWTWRTHIGPQQTIEFIDCVSQDSSGVDQLPAILGNATRMMITDGGGEVYDEPITGTIIDNSYAIKIQPCNPICRGQFTRRIPVLIPISLAEVATVKLSFRKNISQSVGRRPALHIEWPGGYTFTEMTDVNNTWDEVTIVSTAAVADGFVRVWVSAMNEFETVGSGWSPALQYKMTPAAIGTVIVYVDGLDVSIA